jgi:DNA-binding beta-propeller fold protein YncE
MNIKSFSLLLAAAYVAGTQVYANPDVFIAANSADEILGLDGNTDTISREITGINSPHGLTATRDGRYLVIGSLSGSTDASGKPGSQLTLVKTGDGMIEATIPMMSWSHDQLITRDGRYVISTHPNEGRICVIDLDTRQVIRTVDIGGSVNHAVLARDGGKFYVSSGGSNEIVEIDTGDWTIRRRIAAGKYPGQMALSPDGSLIYVISYRDAELSVVSIKYGAVVKTITLAKGMEGIDIDTDGRVFVTSRTGNRLFSVDPGTGTVDSISLPGEPYEVRVVADTGKVYVSSRDLPRLWVIDAKNLGLRGEIKLTGNGHHMAVVE